MKTIFGLRAGSAATIKADGNRATSTASNRDIEHAPREGGGYCSVSANGSQGAAERARACLHQRKTSARCAAGFPHRLDVSRLFSRKRALIRVTASDPADLRGM